jgi:hypothetical protein
MRPLINKRSDIVKKFEKNQMMRVFSQQNVDPNEVYANSQFALIWRGDTPTRRAFYQAIANGCIPVVNESSAEMYKRLFNRNNLISEFMVVIPDYPDFTHDYLEDIDNIEYRIDEMKLHSNIFDFYANSFINHLLYSL